MFHRYPHPRLGQHIRDLQHAGGAARGHHLSLGCSDVVSLAFADGRGSLIVLEIKTAAPTAAPVGFGHLLQDIFGVGLKRPRLGRHSQRFFQVAGVVVGDGNFTILRAGPGRNPQLINQKLAYFQGPGGQVGDPFCSSGSASCIINGQSFLMVEVQVAQAVTR